MLEFGYVEGYSKTKFDTNNRFAILGYAVREHHYEYTVSTAYRIFIKIPGEY